MAQDFCTALHSANICSFGKNLTKLSKPGKIQKKKKTTPHKAGFSLEQQNNNTWLLETSK